MERMEEVWAAERAVVVRAAVGMAAVRVGEEMEAGAMVVAETAVGAMALAD